MAQNPDFVEYIHEVEAYREYRQLDELPLEINARRAYREREQHSVQMIRRFQPQRPKEEIEEAEALKTDEEKILEKQKLPEEDVVLDATLAIMGKVIELNQEEGNAFSFTK